jgi:hypothetical protein
VEALWVKQVGRDANTFTRNPERVAEVTQTNTDFPQRRAVQAIIAHRLAQSVSQTKRQSGVVVINDGCRIPDPAYTRLFQLRSEEGRGYKEPVQ